MVYHIGWNSGATDGTYLFHWRSAWGIRSCLASGLHLLELLAAAVSGAQWSGSVVGMRAQFGHSTGAGRCLEAQLGSWKCYK